jgi:predicted PurR-regulated permease PerM
MNMSNKPAIAPAPLVAAGFGLGFVVLFLAVYALNVAGQIMVPFVIALFVWYLINALARGVGNLPVVGRRIPRFVCFLIGISTLVLGMWFIYTLIGRNVADVAQAAPLYQKNLQDALARLFAAMPFLKQQPTVQELLSYINIEFLVRGAVALFTGIAGKTLVVLFYTGFLLYEQQFFDRKICGMIKDQQDEDRVRRILKNIDIKIQRYIWVKTLVSLMTGLCTFVWLKYFGVDFAEFWGLMAFVLNFIPYVGSLVAIILPACVALIQLTDMSTFTLVFSGLCIIQIIWGSIIDPRMMGDSLNLSPICIIFSLAAWGMIWGVPGMFLSIPILAMIAITLSQFEKTKPIAIFISKTGDIEKDEG